MARGGDKVEQRVDAVVAEAGVSLDAGLLREDVVVLTLEVAHNLCEAAPVSARTSSGVPHVYSLSIWSPKPGVSTTVREMRTPSSSSSAVRQRGLPRRKYGPTLCGWILMPSSWCASSGLAAALCSSTSDSQSVFTNVVRPVPL